MRTMKKCASRDVTAHGAATPRRETVAMHGVVDVVLDDAPEPSCAVAVDALTYAYPGCDAVLRDWSLRLPPG